MKTVFFQTVKYRKLVALLFCVIAFSAKSQIIMFDDFTYSSVNDAQLPLFNKWTIVAGTSGPPEGANYSKNNISFVNDPDNVNNKIMTLSTTVNGQTKATTHSRIESSFEYFEGTYSARVYLSEVPFTYSDANIQTFYTIVSSNLAGDGSKYSELDIVEYMAADKWGTSTNNPVLYVTSWNRYIADPWQAWKRYFAYPKSYAGWHTFTASCTDGVNVKYWIDTTYLGSQATTDNDGSSVYPRASMQVAFANWIWNNVTGSSQTNRTTTMQVDWTLFAKSQELTPAQVITQVNTFRSQGVQRRNLLGQTYVTNPCTVVTQPGVISGNTEVTAGSSHTYSIGAVPSATSYTWTLPTGWSGSSTSTSLTAIAGNTGGTISVKATNACSSSNARTYTVTVASIPPNLALNKPAFSSSNENAGFIEKNAVDGIATTRWSSNFVDAQWIYVDLGANYTINRVKLTWEAAYGRDYQIQVSSDALVWNSIKTIIGNTALTNDNANLNGTGRYVRINATARGTVWGYSIFEFEVYGTPAPPGFSIRIEAEDYLYMGGVIKEPCSEGGQNVGGFDASDWMSYNITIPTTGIYKISYRVSSIYSDKTIRLEKDGGATLLGTVPVSYTGNWQTWTTVSHTVSLPAGAYAIGLTTYSGGLNINWIEIINQGVARVGEELNTTVFLSEESSIVAYPNPIRNTLNFKESFTESTTIQILSYAGNPIMNIDAPSGTKDIDLSTLKSGQYLMKIIGKGNSSVFKITKE